MELISLISGVLFGLILQHAHVNRFNTISGMSTLEDFTMAKVMGFAIGLGAILFAIVVSLGWAEYGVKPLRIVGNVVGGLIFGKSMALLGYCPGTMAISLGEGSLDALAGIVGGMLGGVVYTLLHPLLSPLLGPDLGKISAESLLGGSNAVYFLITVVFGALLMWLAFFFHRMEGRKAGGKSDLRWLVSGVGLALLNTVLFTTLVQGKPIGASTFYPYMGDLLSGITGNAYFEKIRGSGSRQLIFLGGALLGGLIPALIRGDFKFRVVYSRWEHYMGPSKLKRLAYAFIGGFFLIFGARIGGGCASGHILSGMMQLGMGSLLFALSTFAAFFLAGRIFYTRRRRA